MIKKIKSKIDGKQTEKLFRQLIRYSKGYKLKITLITVLGVITSLISIGVALLSKNIIDAAVNHQLDDVKSYALIFTIALLIKIVISKFRTIYNMRVKNAMFNQLQYDLIETYYSHDWLFINQYRTGDLTTRLNNDTSKIVDTLMGTIPNIVSLFVQLITAFVILSKYNRFIALIAFIIGPATLVISWFIGQKLKVIQLEIQESISALGSQMTESLQNIELIKTFNIEKDNLETIKKHQNHRRELLIKKSMFSAIAGGIMDIGYTGGFLSVILLGAYQLYKGNISFGTFTAFSQLVTQIQGPLFGLTRTLPSLITVLSSIERIITFNHDKKEEKHYVKDQDLKHIAFNRVNFAYTPDKLIIKDLDFVLPAKAKIGIKGTSGEGKTTLIRLLLTLVEPQSGSITVNYKSNKYDLSTVSNQYFSYVPQNNSLFSGTLRENLLMANKHATEEELNKALKTADIYTFTKSLDKGLDTRIGERLGGLSEGQAQRYCIARALLHQTPFLIFDEATSALDIQTELNIVNNIEKYYPEKGLVSITHREPILNICDHVYTLVDYKLILKKDQNA